MSEKKHNNDAVVVSVMFKGSDENVFNESLEEIVRLADTAEINVIDKIVQKRSRPDAATYVGKGILEQIKEEYEDIDVVIFDCDLTPSQSRNIEKLTGMMVIDRTEVILSIFNDHAKSREARLQVRLAELQYQLPRLRNLWSHFRKQRVAARSKGSGQAARGMGETQIEVDRRNLRLEIKRINKLLEKIMIQKNTQVQRRRNSKKICLVGYTNAGKSTLFNTLTSAGVLSEDKLFATLDSTARAIVIGRGNEIVLSDTVGFISRLPHHLVASFRATLKDVLDADLLLHVIDFSSPYCSHQIKEVESVLNQIGAEEKPVLKVYNKMDAVKSYVIEKEAVMISAKHRMNIDVLLETVDEIVHTIGRYELFIPHADAGSLSALHELGNVISLDYVEDGVKVVSEINNEDFYHFEKFVVEK